MMEAVLRIAAAFRSDSSNIKFDDGDWALSFVLEAHHLRLDPSSRRLKERTVR